MIYFIISGLFITFSASSIFAQGTEKATLTNRTKIYGKGELRTVEGIRFLKLSGSYYEMGIQYGALMKDEIKEYIRYKEVSKYRMSNSERRIFELCTPHRYLELMRGISKGACIPKDEIEIIWANHIPEKLGCSSILVKSHNYLLHGHNQDRLTPGRFKIMVEFSPENYYKYIVSTYVGTCEVLDGMNEKGITVTSDQPVHYKLHPIKDPSQRYMPPNFKYREILESAVSLKEVDQRWKGYIIDSGLIAVIGSGSETNGCIYDIPYKNMKKNYINENGYIFATNYYLNPELKDHPEKCPRYQIISNHLKSKPVKSVDDMIEILSDPGTSYGVNNEITVHSTVFDPQKYQIYFSFAPSFAAWGKWLKYDWIKDKMTLYREPLGITGQVRLEKISGSRVVSIRSIIPSSEEQTTLRKNLDAYINTHGLTMQETGYTIYHGNKGRNVDVEVVQSIAEKCDGSDQVKFRILKPTKMACVVQTGPYSTFGMVEIAIYKWLLLNDYQKNGPFQACYIKGAWNESDPRKWVTEIRVPVKKKYRWFEFWLIFRR